MFVTVALYFVGFVMAYLSYEMALTPPQNSKAKCGWRIGIGICALIGLGLTIRQYHDAQHQQKEFNDRIDSVRTNLEVSLQIESEGIRTSLTILRQQNQSLLVELATNSSINPDTRQRIIESNSKFEAVDSQVLDWNERLNQMKGMLDSRRALQEIEREKVIKATQDEYDLSVPIYDYTIRTLTDLLGNEALREKDTAISNYRGLQLIINPALRETKMAEIKFQTNTNLDFQVFITGPDSGSHRWLQIKCKNILFEVGTIEIGSTHFDTFVYLPGEDPINIGGTPSDYKPTVNEALDDFIAALIGNTSPTNNPTVK